MCSETARFCILYVDYLQLDGWDRKCHPVLEWPLGCFDQMLVVIDCSHTHTHTSLRYWGLKRNEKMNLKCTFTFTGELIWRFPKPLNVCCSMFQFFLHNLPFTSTEPNGENQESQKGVLESAALRSLMKVKPHFIYWSVHTFGSYLYEWFAVGFVAYLIIFDLNFIPLERIQRSVDILTRRRPNCDAGRCRDIIFNRRRQQLASSR